jgi:hypothetical protein
MNTDSLEARATSTNDLKSSRFSCTDSRVHSGKTLAAPLYKRKSKHRVIQRVLLKIEGRGQCPDEQCIVLRYNREHVT